MLPFGGGETMATNRLLIRAVSKQTGVPIRTTRFYELEPCCDFVRGLFNRKIQEFEGKIAELTATRNRLKALLRQWVSPAAAKRERYAVCPQIESPKTTRVKRRANR